MVGRTRAITYSRRSLAGEKNRAVGVWPPREKGVSGHRSASYTAMRSDGQCGSYVGPGTARGAACPLLGSMRGYRRRDAEDGREGLGWWGGSEVPGVGDLADLDLRTSSHDATRCASDYPGNARGGRARSRWIPPPTIGQHQSARSRSAVPIKVP
jgi:hypothetical protein